MTKRILITGGASFIAATTDLRRSRCQVNVADDLSRET